MRRTELGGSDVAGSVTVNNQKPQQVDPHGVGECGATNANSLSRKAVYHEDTITRLHARRQGHGYGQRHFGLILEGPRELGECSFQRARTLGSCQGRRGGSLSATRTCHPDLLLVKSSLSQRRDEAGYRGTYSTSPYMPPNPGMETWR